MYIYFSDGFPNINGLLRPYLLLQLSDIRPMEGTVNKAKRNIVQIKHKGRRKKINLIVADISATFLICFGKLLKKKGKEEEGK